MEKKQLLSNITSILLGVGIVSAILAICFFVFRVPDFWPQLLAIIASALLGAGATAWITNTLLKNRQELEEAKEKNIKVYENKIQVYSEFISKMWKTLEDDWITGEEIREIRSDIFNKLIFYLEKKDIVELCQKVGSIKKSDDIMDGDDSERTKKTIDCFSEITDLLRADVKKENPTESTQFISSLWNNFGLEPRNTQPLSNLKDEQENEFGQQISIEQNEGRPIPYNFWHFNMWGDEQLFAFRKGLYELALIEYDETWRTNLVQQVKCGDVAFLFRRGGWGYIGAFVVKGWRVIYNNEDGLHEVVYNGQKSVITDVETINRDIDRFDIYKSISDGATSCANLIVEPIAFDFDGVSYPGGVYRRTISRYDGDYARALLSRFLANKDKAYFNMLWEERDGQKVDVVKVDSNAQSFDKLVSDLNIKPAEKDRNGNWL